MSKPSYKSLFAKFRDATVIEKATQYAKWTLPQLMADVSSNALGTATQLERDFQAIGALLVNNLSSKLASLLFPSSRPFYKIQPSEAILAMAKESGAKPVDVAAGLAKLEMSSCKQLYLNASYEQLVLALKHLIVSGTVLLYRDTKTHRTLTYGLQRFVVRRDGRGNMLDCILREFTDFESLDPSIQTVLRLKHPQRYKEENEGSNRVEIYTRIKRDFGVGDRIIYRVSQEADDVAVGEDGVFPEHLCPWQVPNWSLIIGEHYGRSLVEDYAGGFAKLSDESHAAALYGIAACKVINLVAPGTGSDVDDLQAAETGEYVQGQKDAVTAFESGDAAKMAQMAAQIAEAFGSLARAFMYKANTRDAERVTAFELKQDALEAESTLGGVYSSLSASMQIPMAHVLLTEIDPGMLSGIVTGEVKLDIMAGIPALGRQADVQNLAAAAQDAAAIIPVLAQLSNRVDKEKVLDMILAGQSVDTSLIFKDEDQLAEEAQANAQQAEGEAQIAQSTTMADQSAQLQTLQG